MSKSVPAPTADDALPGQTFRSLVTLFLLIHLSCVFVALSAVSDVSPLQIKLLDTLKPYTQLLRLDLNSTRYNLTHGDEHEESHFIEIEHVEGALAGETVTLPDVGMRGTPRRRRYQTLAQVMAYSAVIGNETNLGEFSKAIGANALADQSVGAVVVRCRRHRPQPRDFQQATGDNPKDPFDDAYYSTVYEARVWKDKSGRISVLKLSSAGEAAPLTTESGSDGKSDQ